MQTDVLDATSSTELRVLVVWAPNFPGDARDRWNPRLIADPRAEHFWDGDNVIGRYLKTLAEFDRFPQPIVWDTYIVYDGTATWEADLSPSVGWGATVLGRGDDLLDELGPLLVLQ